VSKGTDTRSVIIERALQTASVVGLCRISLGELARDLALSKSGLFAHFGSKEQLQLAVVEAAAGYFRQEVFEPALDLPRGEARVAALLDNWLSWARSPKLPGGCIFLQATIEYDDQPGVLRDAVVAHQRRWAEALAKAARLAVEEGHFRADQDVEQFAFEATGIFMATQQYARLLGDQQACVRSRKAVADLLQKARKVGFG
jgi:AcrR family transcriptional regulator